MPPTTQHAVSIDVHLRPADLRAAMEVDVRRGLTATPKSLPPIYFYDDRGSELFDEITRLPEYYPTRAERSILRERAREIVERSGTDTLVELGSGTSEKTRILLDAFDTAGRLARFVPFDVSEGVLVDAATRIGAEHPGCAVHAVVGDFNRHLGAIPRDGARMIAFLGGTIGNFEPASRAAFLTALRASMGPDDRLLLGTDLVKDEARLVAAYDDAAGVTAEFNRNVLRVLNRELHADFDVEAFHHKAVWNRDRRWIEMRLVARGAQEVVVADLDLTVHFDDGEELLTEISAKFTPAQVAVELAAAGFTVDTGWTDIAGDFLLTLAAPS